MLFGGHVKSRQDVLFLSSHGFDFGEVVFRDSMLRGFCQDLQSGAGLRKDFFLIAHGPSEGDPNDVSNLWQNYYPKLLSTIEMAEKLGIHFLTVHLWFDPRFVKQNVLTEKLRFLEAIFEAGALHHVLISLENLSENSKVLALVVHHVPEISLTLDVGHGELLAQRNTAYDIVNDLYFSIGHVHLHDNFGGNGVKDDLHLPIGLGKIEIKQILLRLMEKGYDGTVTLELKQDELQDSLNKVKSMVAGFIEPWLISAL